MQPGWHRALGLGLAIYPSAGHKSHRARGRRKRQLDVQNTPPSPQPVDPVNLNNRRHTPPKAPSLVRDRTFTAWRGLTVVFLFFHRLLGGWREADPRAPSIEVGGRGPVVRATRECPETAGRGGGSSG